MSDARKKTLGEKIAEANDPLTGKALAAAQRDDKIRALEEELDGYKRAGGKERPTFDKDARIAAVERELARVKKAPVGRSGVPADQVDADHDGMPDYWELATGSNPSADDAMQLAPDGYTLLFTGLL